MCAGGAQVLVETARTVGCRRRWVSSCRGGGNRPRSTTRKVVLDLAVMLAVGGDCPADVTLSCPGWVSLFGPVASTATISRLVAALAASGEEGCRRFGQRVRLPGHRWRR